MSVYTRAADCCWRRSHGRLSVSYRCVTAVYLCHAVSSGAPRKTFCLLLNTLYYICSDYFKPSPLHSQQVILPPRLSFKKEAARWDPAPNSLLPNLQNISVPCPSFFPPVIKGVSLPVCKMTLTCVLDARPPTFGKLSI